MSRLYVGRVTCDASLRGRQGPGGAAGRHEPLADGLRRRRGAGSERHERDSARPARAARPGGGRAGGRCRRRRRGRSVRPSGRRPDGGRPHADGRDPRRLGALGHVGATRTGAGVDRRRGDALPPVVVPSIEEGRAGRPDSPPHALPRHTSTMNLTSGADQLASLDRPPKAGRRMDSSERAAMGEGVQRERGVHLRRRPESHTA